MVCVRRHVAVLFAVTMVLAIASPLLAEYKVRPFWGGEALWNYWEFEDNYVPKKDWKIVSVSQESAVEQWKSPNMIDDNAESFYYPSGQDSYDVTINLGKAYELGAFTILTLGRPDNKLDSTMEKYELFVSEAADAKGKAAAAGTFSGEVGEETVVVFPAAKGRYVTLRAYARKNPNKEVCIREFSLVEAAAVKKVQGEKQAAAVEKEKRWKDRDSDAAIEAFAKEFLDMLFISNDEINRSNLRSRPQLPEMDKLRKAGKYAEALKLFRSYYFDKLRRPQAFGIPANDVHLYGRGFAGLGGFPAGAFEMGDDGEAANPTTLPRHGGIQQRSVSTGRRMASSSRRRFLACEARAAAFFRWSSRISAAIRVRRCVRSSSS